jgi:hypothetical protein
MVRFDILQYPGLYKRLMVDRGTWSGKRIWLVCIDGVLAL